MGTTLFNEAVKIVTCDQIVMEYCAGGSMSDIYEATNKVLTEAQARATMAFCVLGLHHLHSHRSIHRVRQSP
jgi:serine/threonine protein kinase